MIHNLKLNKVLWGVTTLLAFFAAVYGLINNSIYFDLFPLNFIAAQLPQDWLTILVCIFLTWLIITTKEDSIKRPIIILGIMGALAYLYAIFSIERVYNVLYLVYLTILGTSFFSIAVTIYSLNREKLKSVDVSKGVRTTTAIISLLIAILFTFLWVSALLPLMATKTQIQNLYSIYLLDLVFVMPSFVITAVMTFRKNPLGYVLTPAMDILGIFVILPLGLGELAKPIYGLAVDTQSMMMSFVLSGLFIFLAVWQVTKIKVLKPE
jgi:hypothetical protein